MASDCKMDVHKSATQVTDNGLVKGVKTSQPHKGMKMGCRVFFSSSSVGVYEQNNPLLWLDTSPSTTSSAMKEMQGVLPLKRYDAKGQEGTFHSLLLLSDLQATCASHQAPP